MGSSGDGCHLFIHWVGSVSMQAFPISPCCWRCKKCAGRRRDPLTGPSSPWSSVPKIHKKGAKCDQSAMDTCPVVGRYQLILIKEPLREKHHLVITDQGWNWTRVINVPSPTRYKPSLLPTHLYRKKSVLGQSGFSPFFMPDPWLVWIRAVVPLKPVEQRWLTSGPWK